MTRRFEQKNRPQAEAKAAAHLAEIKRLLAKIGTEAEGYATDASWPAVGSLGHIRETLAALAGEEG